MTGAHETVLKDWLGRTTEAVDVVTERLSASFRAIFEPTLAPVEEGFAPVGIHWCLSPHIAGMDQLGPDGHPAKNLFLPPIPLPRRMWAGGTVETLDSLRLGDRVLRTSTIADITRKDGRSGELWFVAVDHVFSTDRGPALRERHDIVYREAARTGEPPRVRAPDGWERRPADWVIEPTATYLFRYSAITFNGHRIHYDLPYARDVEGYEGLVVHGPIQATLLLNLAAAKSGRVPMQFRYRGIAPATAGRPLSILGGDGGTLWTERPDGVRHMEASVR